MKMFLLLEPPTITAQESKVALVHNKPIFYKPEKVKEARNTLIKHLKPFKPKEPLQGALQLNAIWRFSKGKSHKHYEWRITKPDTDNLEKMLKDCMTEVGFWNDDAQVVVEKVEKIWTDEPTGIEIEITELGRFKEAEDGNGI